MVRVLIVMEEREIIEVRSTEDVKVSIYNKDEMGEFKTQNEIKWELGHLMSLHPVDSLGSDAHIF